MKKDISSAIAQSDHHQIGIEAEEDGIKAEVVST